MPKKNSKPGTVTSESLRAEIIEEYGRPEPRHDVIIRKVGQLNRIEGRKRHRALLQLIGKPNAQKNVSEILGDDR